MSAKRDVTEIEAYSGRYVNLLVPSADQITLGDIAVGLSNACRFGNQVSRWYSVAEHSVRVAEAVAPGYELAALFHDAHEAYTGDITAPMKKVLEMKAPGVLKEMQWDLDCAIAEYLCLDPFSFKAPHIKEMDDLMMYREAAGLKYSHGIGHHWGNEARYEPLAAYGWSPAEAERRFIDCYRMYR